MKFKLDKDLLAADVTTKRQVKNRLSMREVGDQIGVSAGTVCRVETKSINLSVETFTKFCAWLDKSPGTYFKMETV